MMKKTIKFLIAYCDRNFNLAPSSTNHKIADHLKLGGLFVIGWNQLQPIRKQKSGVHVLLVSLLVDQLSGLFLIFFGRPKINLSSLREFLVSLWEFLVDQISFWYTKIFFGRPNSFLVNQTFPETDQKFPKTGQFFFVNQKNEKKTEQLVDQETDQNHMDGTMVKS